jgi:hypothetical protein
MFGEVVWYSESIIDFHNLGLSSIFGPMKLKDKDSSFSGQVSPTLDAPSTRSRIVNLINDICDYRLGHSRRSYPFEN